MRRAGGPAGGIEWGQVEGEGGDGASLYSHHVTPARLMRVAVTAYGRVPPVFVVGVGGEGVDIGAALSPEVAGRPT